jgi:hypothetical protein
MKMADCAFAWVACPALRAGLHEIAPGQAVTVAMNGHG